MKPLTSINPATEQLIAEYAETSEADVENRLGMADDAYRRWRRTSFAQRAELISELGELLKKRRDALATLMTREMGKPITQARAEIEKCGTACDYFARNAEQFLADRRVDTEAAHSFVRCEPLGPILAIMPWNFPFWQLFRFAVPATMAGNVTVLKHASNVTGSALAIEELFVEAGLPVGTLTTLVLSSQRAEQLIEHPLIRGVTLTGSDRAGRQVAARAGRSLKKAVLELGGSDPFIVLRDADLGQAAKAAARARTQNSGQSCIAAKRFIVEEPVAAEFAAALTGEMQRLKVGDPLDESTDVGPLAREDLRDALHDQVCRSIQQGAELNTGGEPLDRKGYFYAPTVLDRVEPGMAAFDEETFGAVAAVVHARDRDQAIALANRSRFGLGASLWTADASLGAELTREIDAGCVFVNEVVKSDPRLPFGGIKDSGCGRELAEEGIREFVNVKTVWVR